MRWKTILRVQGLLLILLAVAQMLPLVFSLFYEDGAHHYLITGILFSLGTGILLLFVFRAQGDIRPREGYLIVSLGWMIAAVFGAIPFWLHGGFGTLIDCVFETMSGLTTTGATVLSDIESVPQGLLFWRSMTHWLGGMGIILLTIAILPIIGLTSGQLYVAEVPGPSKERISPKIKTTAKILWLIYLGMTIVQTGLLALGGMSLYEALCQTFGTLATGGFSTKNASIAGFDSLYIELVIIFFMYLAGINFILHFQMIRGDIRGYLRDREWVFYTSVLLIAIVLIGLNLYFSGPDGNDDSIRGNAGMCLREAAFQAVSITTTTGFCTANFDLWPSFSRMLLVILMFFGGCAGSTGGGIKQVRIMVVLKKVKNEIRKLAHPRGIFSVRLGHEAVPDQIVRNIVGFFILFVLIFAGVTLFLCAMGYDIVTAFSASIATLGNIGPGLARVGAIENYAFFDPISKIMLTLSMLLGRLEVYSVLILFYAIGRRN